MSLVTHPRLGAAASPGGPTPSCGAAQSTTSGATSAGPANSACAAAAPEAAFAAPQNWAVYAQSTVTEQYHPAFASLYRGPQSLDPGSRGDETADVTLYGGVRPWAGGEIWVNPEVEQGFGLSNTFGVAGYPSGESYKLGAAVPYVRLQRLFLRQTIDLGGKSDALEPDLNQLGGSQSENHVVVTIGKFSVVDIFDTNKFAHDARNDFLNWSLIDAGSFDYAADAWGYTYGVAAEWYQSWWTVRGGIVDMPTSPAYKYLDPRLGQEQFLAELEGRFALYGQTGTFKLTGFLTRGELGNFNRALSVAAATGTSPRTSSVLNYRSRGGVSLDVQQPITSDLGLFARAGAADGSADTTAFTDIDKSFSLGISLTGARWRRVNDTVGIGFVENDISRHFKNYLAAGGLATLIGDGRLPNSGPEHIVELYYSVGLTDWAKLTADYQFIDNPAYNEDRGPVSVLGARLHVQI